MTPTRAAGKILEKKTNLQAKAADLVVFNETSEVTEHNETII